MIEVIVRETDDEPNVIVVFGCGDYASRYRITDNGELWKWERYSEPKMGAKGRWITLREGDK